jgi:CRP/FNR family cyclic AMP-dependent transcriptional regulator
MQLLEKEVDVLEKTKNQIILESNFPTEAILKSKGKTNIYNKDELIFSIGQSSKDIFVIEKGRVKIGRAIEDGKDILRAILEENDIFGEMILSGELLRKDYAIAMDDNTIVKSVSFSEMKEIMHLSPEINQTIFQLLGRRIRRTERRLSALILKDARTRIVDFLKELAEEKGRKVGFETMIKNHFTHKDIANLTGTSRQTVTTTLNALRDQNIINFDRRRILIRDLDLLE